MKIQQQTAEEALRSLRSGPGGLTEAEARRRLEEFGPNEVERLATRHWSVMVIGQLTHFFAIVLWLAAGLAFLAESYQPGEGMATLGLAIVAVVLINGGFSFWQEYRAERTVAALQRILPHTVKTVREGRVRELAAVTLVPGDVIDLAEGDDIPADCRVVETFGLRANTATITGESLPVAKHGQPVADNDLIHSPNLLLAGTSVVSGAARAVVFATGMHTEFGQIARLTQTAPETISPLQREIVFLSRIITLIAAALGIACFFLGRRLGLSAWDNLLFAIGIIVANVPEGLLPAVTLALAMASQRMARRNALVRHLPAVQTLGSATVICTDKTGTLTENRMRVRSLYVDGEIVAVEPFLAAVDAGRRRERLFETVLLCEDVKEGLQDGRPALLGDPMEVALATLGRRGLAQPPRAERVDELGFSTDRKRLSVLYRTPGGLALYTKGAPETVLPLCAQVEHAAATRSFTAADRASYLAAQERMAQAGLRVLALAWRPVAPGTAREELESGLTLLGLVGLEDPPRPEVPQAVARCREAGIRILMATGDHPKTALAIGREIGLYGSADPEVVTGEQLTRMSPAQLQLLLDGPEVLFARTGADHKLRIVQALQSKKHIVAMTGDGVNDAPALKAADIGIAMGRSGTDVARESADLVLLDDNFASIVAAVEEGRAVFANIRKFLTYILTSNVPEIVPYLAFVLFKIPLPLTIVQILAVDLGTDMVPALGLGVEPPEADIMRRPPLAAHERLIDVPLILRSYLWLGLLEAAVSLSAYGLVLASGGWRWGETLGRLDPLYMQATTACLAAIVASQVANVFLCRSERRPVLGLAHNRLIPLGIGVELALLALLVYSPVGQALFGTAAFPPWVWALCAVEALAMFALEEARKGVLRWLG